MYNVVNVRTGKTLFESETMELTEETLSANGYWYDASHDCVCTKDGYGSTIYHYSYDVACEVKMSYREYKQNYSDCATKKGSYDSFNKTVVVYVQR